MKTLQLINRTDSDIVFGSFVIPVGGSPMLYDISDKTTYEPAMMVCRNFFDQIKYSVLSKSMDLIYDGVVKFTNDAQFVSLWSSLQPIFTNHTIGYSSEHRFYFDLGLEAFCVKNVITGKTYRIKMEKEGDGTPWINEGGGI